MRGIIFAWHARVDGRAFDVPVVEQHHRILDAVRGLDDRWVFPLPTAKSGYIVAWDHEEVPETLHAIRKTFGAAGTEAGVPEEMIGCLLNHTPQTITGRVYVKPDLDFMRAAMQVAVDEIERRLNAGTQDPGL